MTTGLLIIVLMAYIPAFLQRANSSSGAPALPARIIFKSGLGRFGGARQPSIIREDIISSDNFELYFPFKAFAHKGDRDAFFLGYDCPLWTVFKFL